MGCGNSGMRDRFQEGMVPMRKFMGRMTITEDDLWPLFKQFDKCDGDHSGEINFDEALNRGIVATRQLAKRQLTWMRGWHELNLLPIDDGKNSVYVCHYI